MKASHKPLHIFTIFFIAFLSVTNISFAQDIINEDFLDNIETNARFILGESSPAFAVTVAPEKWKKESATIIGYKRSILFDKKSSGGFFTAKDRSVYFFEKVRFRIKLNDNNAVQSFTQIFFRYSDREDGFIARLIKPNGEIIEVDLKDAVGIEPGTDMPEFFKSFFDQISGEQRRYFKVAIPDLEPGDILEYVANTKSKLNVSGAGYVEFSPQYEICSKNYPVMHNEIVIETDEKSFFKSLSLNGAPEFKKEATDAGNFTKYVFTDKDRGTEKDVNFVKEMLVYPLVKFQVIYSNNGQVKGALIGQKGELKKGFSKEELALKAWEDYESVGSNAFSVNGMLVYTINSFINDSWASLKKLGAKDWTEKDYVKNVYYYVRNKVLFQNSYLSDKAYAYIFGSLLYQRDIKSDLIITTSNRIGNLNQILFEEEIRYALRVGNQLYFNCTDHSNPGEFVETLLGNEGYIITKPTKKVPQEIKPFKLPDAGIAENMAHFAITASLTPDLNNIAVSRVNTFKGISKSRNIDAALKFTSYMLDDYKFYGGNDPADGMRAVQQEEYEKSIRALKEEFKRQKPEFVKEQLEREYRQKIKYKDFKIGSDGRSVKKSDLVFTEDFELPGMIRKAGKKYLVNLTGLVGPQLQIKKEERERTFDINVGYARTLTWAIMFKIPDGYTVDGIAELNSVVENEAGKFSCEAKEENGQVLMKISKVYKQANISKSKWTDMLTFVDAAYNNSFRYLLLKPKK
ncbi:MAG: DUF3857 domain-containing protein [Chitinophagaceae bacterium]|nr:DUF3857 domain-containing protein [Chitinophagaceae bacterium]